MLEMLSSLKLWIIYSLLSATDNKSRKSGNYSRSSTIVLYYDESDSYP